MVFTPEGIMNMKNEKWKYDFTPVDEAGILPPERSCSKAFLRHLIVSGEMLGAMLASLHNLAFYLWLMKHAREKIIAGEFSSWKEVMIKKLAQRI
jgi:queuine tRNA-ribosyltransferase